MVLMFWMYQFKSIKSFSWVHYIFPVTPLLILSNSSETRSSIILNEWCIWALMPPLMKLLTVGLPLSDGYLISVISLILPFPPWFGHLFPLFVNRQLPCYQALLCWFSRFILQINVIYFWWSGAFGICQKFALRFVKCRGGGICGDIGVGGVGVRTINAPNTPPRLSPLFFITKVFAKLSPV